MARPSHRIRRALEAVERRLDRALDLSVWGFALWTLLCWILTAAGAAFALLVALSPAVLGLWWVTRSVAVRPPDTGPLRSPAELTGALRLEHGSKVGLCWGVTASLLAAAAGFGFGQWRLGWLLATVSLLIAASSARWTPRPARASAARDVRRGSILLGILLAMLVAASARRPDADDGGYHSVSLAAAEEPEAPLLSRETLHGVDAPLAPPTQKLKSLELLAAVPVLLAAGGGLEVPPWPFYHLLLPLWGAVALCLAHRRLYRLLAPERWRAAFWVTLVLLMTLGTAHAWHGNFGLVRLHQGKGLLVSVLLPLISVYGLEAGAAGGPRRWLRLVAAQVAAVGVSQTALVVAPATALLTVLAGLPERRSPRRAARWALAAAASPALIGVAFWPAMSARFEQAVANRTAGELVRRAADYVLGDGALPLFAALGILLCPWCVRPGMARRWAVLAPLAVLAGPLNPWLCRTFAGAVFGGTTFWRLFWLLPLIPAFALVLTAAEGGRRPAPRLARGASILALLALLVVADEWILSPQNGVDWAPFSARIPPLEGAAAAALVAAVPPRSVVLAPHLVAPWVALHPDRPYLWSVAPRYLRRAFGFREERARLLRFASGLGRPDRRILALLARRLPQFSGAVLHRDSAGHRQVEDLLRGHRFERRGQFGPYQLWIRRLPETDSRPGESAASRR